MANSFESSLGGHVDPKGLTDTLGYRASRVLGIGELRQIIVPLARRRRIASVSIFGSYARGEADADSDIDILVDRGGGKLTRILGLGTEVERATGKTVDIYDMSELVPGPFRETVLREKFDL